MRVIRAIKTWRIYALLVVMATGMGVAGWTNCWPMRERTEAMVSRSREPLHLSGVRPDHIILAPAGDMSTSLSVSWRTSSEVRDGFVRLWRGDAASSEDYAEIGARCIDVTADELTRDTTVHCFSATLTGLEPGTTYAYRVGSRERNVWSDTAAFDTAPPNPASFSFVYLGDTQVGPERAGDLVGRAEAEHPEAAFYMIGGDLVDTGDPRNEWDDLIVNPRGVFSRKPVAPTMGNHDFGELNSGSALFNAYFNPPNRDPELPDVVENYSFRYGGAYFIVINRFFAPAQTKWLERELRSADALAADFKIVMFHCPVYNPKRHRNNVAAQRLWVPFFDGYRVDLVLTGHDHSYLRTKPLRGGKPVGEGEFGTTYVVANACDKFYPYEPLAVAETQLADVATYQVITLGVDDAGRRRLRYAAHDGDGRIVDAFETDKPAREEAW